MEPKTDAYNGWANYETWAVNLWLSSEPTPYKIARDLAASAASE